MLLVTTFLIFLATAVHGQHQLIIRDNGKLCSAWISITGSYVSLIHVPNSECVGQVGLQQNGAYLRLCCPVMAVATTPSSVFPRECGKQQYQPLKTRIVGGAHAQPNSWPWQVRLELGGGLCGGTLIDTRHILTAAHCFQSPLILSNYHVFVGIHNINQPVYAEQRMAVAQVYIHEQYNTRTQQHDIAIIRLAKPVVISDKVNVICLPGPEANGVNETVYATGFGTTSNGGSTSPVLKQAKLNTMPHRCPQIYGNYDNRTQMCAGAHGGGHDTCQGDSGGPLMYESNGQWFLNGVVSYGHQCGLDGFPGVYARVSYYLSWIRIIISRV